MKKNRMCRLASALLILVLLTTSIVGSTFAKYTTKGTATDTARVAKWGVTVSSTGNAFATAYDTKENNVTDADGVVIAKSVVTATGADADGKKLVAPGTKGGLLSSSITGTPEVAVEVSTSAELTLTGWEITVDDGTGGTTTKTYCPIVITIDGTPYRMGDATDETTHTYATIADFKTAVEAALKTTGEKYGPNTNLAGKYGRNVAWEWEFEDTAGGGYQTNEKDTALGNLSPAPTIEFTYTATVTQID